MKRRRIQFTRKELNLILRMAAIADAGSWGEGDYQDWNEKDAKPFESLRNKALTLLDRKTHPKSAIDS